MKKWKCTVCGYIHTGDEPPEKCPVCGAPKSKFVELGEDGKPKAAAEKPKTDAEPKPATPEAAQSGQGPRKWKCTACGYIHTGDEPPEKCPVCGAPKSKFVELGEDGKPKAAVEKPKTDAEPPKPAEDSAPKKEAVVEEKKPLQAEAAEAEPSTSSAPTWFQDPKYRKWFDMMTKFHGHPISVHLPNGLLPIAVFFLFLSAFFGFKGMATAAIYNLGVVALSMPLVLFTGWVDWQNRFGGARTTVFTVKIACGITVTITSWVLFIWLLINPDVVNSGQVSRAFFFLINIIMLGAAGTAGWFGGKLVFKD